MEKRCSQSSRLASSCTARKRAGIARALALKQLQELAGLLPVMGLPETAAQAYGAMRAALERKGMMIGNNDLWIAAHAKSARLTLVTNNVCEFARVESLDVQNWAI